MGVYNVIPKLAAKRTSKKENDNFIMLIVGDTGSGKSYAGMVTGLMSVMYASVMHDPEEEPIFNEDTIVFRPAKMMELLDEGLPPQSIIQLDEGGEIANARKWYSDPNDVITSTIDTFRADRLALIWCTPDPSRIDKNVREEADVIAQMTRKKHMKVQNIVKDRVSKQILHPYPTMKGKVLKGNTANNDYSNVKVADVYKVLREMGRDESMIEEYEKRKKKFIDEVQKKGREKLEENKSDKKLDMMDVSGYILKEMDLDFEEISKDEATSVVVGRLKAEHPEWDFSNNAVRNAINYIKQDREHAEQAVDSPFEEGLNDKEWNPGMTEDFKENYQDYWPMFKRLYIGKDLNLRETANAMNVAFRQLYHRYRHTWQDRVEEMKNS